MGSLITVYQNSGEMLTLRGALKKRGRFIKEEDLSILQKGSLILKDGLILFCGSDIKERDKILQSLPKKNEIHFIDLEGRDVIPAFVESHTHLVFAGDRQNEFEERIAGATYQEIANRGGGILKTVHATREALFDDLLTQAQRRVNRFIDQGVGALEIKSGYGLSFESEKKMLQVIRALKGCEIRSTYLAGHAVPVEYNQQRELYFQDIVLKGLESLNQLKLIDRVDLFIEQNSFTKEEGYILFSRSKELGLEVTAHVEQLTRQGGLLVALDLQAQSTDHVIHLNTLDIQKLSQSETTAVLLPGADFYLKVAYPKAREMIDQGVRVALATDFNPGSSPTQDLSFIGVLARLEMKMTASEVMGAYTVGGAFALGLETQLGALDVGYRGVFNSIDDSWRNLFYQVGYHPVKIHKNNETQSI